MSDGRRTASGREVLVYRRGGEVKAPLAICTHLGGPLGLKDGELVCLWHGARFDAASRAMLLPN